MSPAPRRKSPYTRTFVRADRELGNEPGRADCRTSGSEPARGRRSFRRSGRTAGSTGEKGRRGKGNGGLRLFSGRLRAPRLRCHASLGSATPTLQRVATRGKDRVPCCCSPIEQCCCQSLPAGRIAAHSANTRKQACFRGFSSVAAPARRRHALPSPSPPTICPPSVPPRTNSLNYGSKVPRSRHFFLPCRFMHVGRIVRQSTP